MTKQFNEDTFHGEVLTSDKLAVVDFYTPTCGPCRRLAPTIDKLSEEYGEAVSIGKVNASENMKLSSDYKISVVPTILFIKDGKEVDRQTGLLSEDALRKLIEKHK